MLEPQSIKNKIVTKMERLERWWYLSKLLTITITSFNFFNCPVKSLRSSKCLKTTVECNVYTQKANTCSPWTACPLFDWKYLFWVNLIQKLKIIS